MHEQIALLEQELSAACNQVEKVDALNKLAWALAAKDPRRAVELSQAAYNWATGSSEGAYPAGAAASLVNLGRFYYQLSRLDRAQSCLEQAQPLILQLDEPGLLLIRLEMGMGLIRWRIGDYSAALKHLLQALRLCRERGDQTSELNLLNNIGMVYGVTGEYAHALEIYDQLLTLCQSNDRLAVRGFAHNNIAMVHARAGNHALALQHAQESLAAARSIGHAALEVNALDSAGAAHLGLGNDDEALELFQASAVAAAELGDRHGEVAAWLHVGEVHARQNKIGPALDALHFALELTRQLEDREQIRQCHFELAQLHKQAGDYAAALAHFEQFHAADQAIYSERADMRFKTLQVIHETETARKEAEIAHLRNVELEHEIAERRQVEAALRESEARFRNLAEELPIGVLVYAADGTLQHANRASGQMALFQPGIGPAGHNLLDYGRVRELGLQALVEAAFAGQAVEFPIVAIDPARQPWADARRWYRLYAYSLYGEQGEIRDVALLAEDMTEQKQATELLQQAQKMESLGVLAGGVAHDFNNLLAATMTQSSLALGKMEEDAPARRHVVKAMQAMQRAADVARQMLAYSGRGHFDVQTVDLNELIRGSLHLITAVLPTHVALHLQPSPHPLPVAADASQFQQLLVNLILNGAEALGDEPGYVQVATELITLESPDGAFHRHTGAPLAPGRYARLTVTDNGSGISPAVMGRIFDPFFSTRATGRGLGLAAALGIVRGHRGGITVHSEDGRGTTMEILLPAASLPELAPAEPELPRRSAGRLVLVIDDETAVLEAVADILALDDISVLLAGDGPSGLALYRQHAGAIGLVILDLSMPGMDGAETFRQLREIDATVQVLLSSGYSDGELTRRLGRHQPAGLLKKPYSVDELLATVRQRLGD